MELNTFSGHIKKTTALLQQQLRLANINGDFIINQNSVEYGIGIEKNELDISIASHNSDVQKLHLKLTLFIEDLRRREVTFRTLPEIEGDNWHDQVKNLCSHILLSSLDSVTRLSYHYSLGILLEHQLWNNTARNEIRKLFTPRKYLEIWKITHR
ncbi:6309_t:CDS:2 [Racocetra persica]|uniref:6309_t:CDS:1 n=1 Tax=Racocetra persica TaxID=160502 RepID=A0ACA9L7I3_9GLOM|nr:6309_t:CDS:2 [Racocetra persica]